MTRGPIFSLAGLIFLIIALLMIGFSKFKNLNQSEDTYGIIKGMAFIIAGILVSFYTIYFISSYSIDFLLVVLVLISIFAYYLCQKIF